MSKGRILFLSYDGMTDPLGQSQVLPYLSGLQEKGHFITLLSFEKPDRFLKYGVQIQELCNENNIKWYPLTYTKKPPVLSTLKDLKRMKQKAKEICSEGIDLIHCRSYIAALAGLEIKREAQIPFLFDMRGFWADERVEGGVWNLGNPIFKFIYRFFKRKEKQFFREAAAIISLTEAGKKEIRKMSSDADHSDIVVIPCSADFDLFTVPDEDGKKNAKKALGVGEDSIVISYLGSIGTWYMLDEMLDFIAILLKNHPGCYFHFLTPENKTAILEPAQKKGIPSERIIVEYSQRKELPSKLAASDVGLFFVKPCFSKLASSPTKLGEYLAMGIPVICNSGVGDVEDIVKNTEGGFVIQEFEGKAYQQASDALSDLIKKDKKRLREKAFNYYSLEKAVNQYHDTYLQILHMKRG